MRICNLQLALSFVVLVFFGMVMVDVGHAGLSLDKVLGIWLFDEGSGDTAEDSSGNGNDAKEVQKGPSWTDGKFGKALKFEQKGWWECDNPVMTASVDFTMGCWTKPGKAQKTWTNILSSHQEPPRRGISFEQSSDKQNLFGIAIGDGPNWGGAPHVQLKAGEWNHMAFVRKGDNGAWYRNGKFDNEQKLESDDPVVTPTSNFRIGNWVLGGREYNGLVDEAFLFERALSKDEIATIADLGLEGAQPVTPKDRAATCWGKLKSWRGK